MKEPNAFSVRIVGSFYSYPLYDKRGREIRSLPEAIETAEEMYGDEWLEVFNGERGTSRDDWARNE